MGNPRGRDAALEDPTGGVGGSCRGTPRHARHRGQLLSNRGDPGDGSGGVGAARVGAVRAPGAAVRPEQPGMPGVPPGPAPAPAALRTGGVAGEGSPGNSPGKARRGAAGDPPPPDPARRLPPCPSRSRRVPGSTGVRGPGADSPAVRTPRRRSGPAPRAGAAAPRAARRARSRRRRRRGRWAGSTGRASPGLPAPGPPRRGGCTAPGTPASPPAPLHPRFGSRLSRGTPSWGDAGRTPPGASGTPQTRSSGRPQPAEPPGSPGPRVGTALAGAARSRALLSRLSPQPGAAPAPYRPREGGFAPGSPPSATERDPLPPAASRRHRHRLLGETRAAAGSEAGGALRVPVRPPALPRAALPGARWAARGPAPGPAQDHGERPPLPGSGAPGWGRSQQAAGTGGRPYGTPYGTPGAGDVGPRAVPLPRCRQGRRWPPAPHPPFSLESPCADALPLPGEDKRFTRRLACVSAPLAQHNLTAAAPSAARLEPGPVRCRQHGAAGEEVGTHRVGQRPSGNGRREIGVPTAGAAAGAEPQAVLGNHWLPPGPERIHVSLLGWRSPSLPSSSTTGSPAFPHHGEPKNSRLQCSTALCRPFPTAAAARLAKISQHQLLPATTALHRAGIEPAGGPRNRRGVWAPPHRDHSKHQPGLWMGARIPPRTTAPPNSGVPRGGECGLGSPGSGYPPPPALPPSVREAAAASPSGINIYGRLKIAAALCFPLTCRVSGVWGSC